MNIFLNNLPTKLPSDYMTVQDLAEWKGVEPMGTEIVVNDKIVRNEQWPITNLKEFDRVAIVSATFCV